MSAWSPPERPDYAVEAAYRLAAPWGPFHSILEFGTSLRRGEALLCDGGTLSTTNEPILGVGARLDHEEERYDLVIALHVLEHCHDPIAAVKDLWSMTSRYLLVEVPALEIETFEQAFDDVNPGHLSHWSMAEFLFLMGGVVIAVEAVRLGPWPCNRALLELGSSSLGWKRKIADHLYSLAAGDIKAFVLPGDAYLGKGYSHSQLIAHGAPHLPVYDTFKNPVPRDFVGRLILTPRYLPTRLEMREQFKTLTLVDPWNFYANH